MRSRVQYYAAATLDGYIADPDDGLGWLFGYDGTYAGDDGEPGPMGDGLAYERFYDGVGALVSGSATYEFILGHEDTAKAWPYAGKPYWVLSSRDLPVPDGEDVRVVSADITDIHDELTAAAGGRNIWIIGGGPVATQYAEAGLLDDVLITVVPVVIGEGKPLFEGALPGSSLRLTGTTVFANGMVELRYERG